jgi:hypothetical protein
MAPSNWLTSLSVSRGEGRSGNTTWQADGGRRTSRTSEASIQANLSGNVMRGELTQQLALAEPNERAFKKHRSASRVTHLQNHFGN